MHLQGDIVAILDSNGTTVVQYKYDAWGKPISKTGSMASTLGTVQPFRYRGYVYDEETNFYYLNQRYYSFLIGRFMSPDSVETLTTSLLALTDKNLFAYCDNNPVVRLDHGGDFWDVFFDIASLASSVIEVIVNPASPSAWIGLAADVVCTVVPGLTGVGAVVDILVKGDDVVDTARTLKNAFNHVDNATDAANAFRKSTGTYEVMYKSGRNYVGKGGFERAITSAAEHCSPNKINNYAGDVVESIRWVSAKDDAHAFAYEALWQLKRGVGKNGRMTYNKIWSPGRRYLK